MDGNGGMGEWGNGMIIESYCGSFLHSLLSTSKYIYAPRSCHWKKWKKQGASATASSVWSWPATFRRFLATNMTPLPQWSWVPCHALVPEISENANWKMGIEADWKLKTSVSACYKWQECDFIPPKYDILILDIARSPIDQKGWLPRRSALAILKGSVWKTSGCENRVPQHLMVNQC